MSTVSELFSAIPVQHGGVVRWGDPVPVSNPGIYVVALSPDPSRNAPLLNTAPLDSDAINEWLARTTGICLDSNPNPTPEILADRLRKYWLADESTLYIGQSTRPLSRRIEELYRHRLGKRSPHRGGHWIKALSILNDLFVHYAESSRPKWVECRLIEMFAARVSTRSRAQIGPDDHAFPFANLELKCPKRTVRKKHGLRRQAI